MKNMFHTSRLSFLLIAFLALSSLALAQHTMEPGEQANQNKLAQEDQDKLVQIVRNATEQYQDVRNAKDYTPVDGCVSGPDHGAMGIHYLNPNLLNGPIDPTHPQALIYEPQRNGELKLVGVEFIILATALPPNSAPEVEGHLMNYIDSPNRYGIPVPLFELHVWAWRHSPLGPFVDWNNHVSCSYE
jgi:hypothetical protein